MLGIQKVPSPSPHPTSSPNPSNPQSHHDYSFANPIQSIEVDWALSDADSFMVVFIVSLGTVLYTGLLVNFPLLHLITGRFRNTRILLLGSLITIVPLRALVGCDTCALIVVAEESRRALSHTFTFVVENFLG